MRKASHSAEQSSPRGVITLSEVLRIIDSGAAFSITVTTCDRAKGTGGQLRHWPVAQLCRLADMPANLLKRNGIRSTAGIDRRNPNHHDNKTRNLLMPQTGEIRKIHIKLINYFNNKTVLL